MSVEILNTLSTRLQELLVLFTTFWVIIYFLPPHLDKGHCKKNKSIEVSYWDCCFQQLASFILHRYHNALYFNLLYFHYILCYYIVLYYY